MIDWRPIMKKVLIFTVIILSFLMINLAKAQADVGPKRTITITIKGLETQKYTFTLLGLSPIGPYRNWESDSSLEKHPIMDYKDDEEYQFVGMYWKEESDSEITWSYMPPDPFKVLIMTEDEKMYVTEKLDAYAFSTYYTVDLSNIINSDINEENTILITSVKRSYDYGKEIISFLLLVILTI